MGYERHLRFLDEALVVSLADLEALRCIQKEADPLAERLLHRRPSPPEKQLATASLDLVTASVGMGETVVTAIETLTATPVRGPAAWWVRREVRKFQRSLTRARHQSEVALADLRTLNR